MNILYHAQSTFIFTMSTNINGAAIQSLVQVIVIENYASYVTLALLIYDLRKNVFLIDHQIF